MSKESIQMITPETITPESVAKLSVKVNLASLAISQLLWDIQDAEVDTEDAAKRLNGILDALRAEMEGLS